MGTQPNIAQALCDRGTEDVMAVKDKQPTLAVSIKGQTSVERRFYVSSLLPDAQRMNDAVRRHWRVESVPQAHRKEVRNGLTNCVEATRKMRVGPSGSAFRSGPQTTPSGCGQEPWW